MSLSTRVFSCRLLRVADFFRPAEAVCDHQTALRETYESVPVRPRVTKLNTTRCLPNKALLLR
jgi:hypothetical protein